MRLNQKQLIFVLLFFSSAHSGLFAMRTETSKVAIYKAHSKPQHKINLEILNYITFTGNEKVLHVECADGSISNEVAKKAAYVFGIDRNKDMVDSASRTYPNIKFKKSAIEEVIKSDSDAYDVILSLLGSQCIQDPEEAFKQIYKHLKPGGIMLFALIAPIPNHPAISYALEASKNLGLSLIDNGGYGANGYKNMLSELGFENILAKLKMFDLSFNNGSEFKFWLKAREKLHEIMGLNSMLIDEFVTCYVRYNKSYDGTISYSLPVVILKATKPQA